MSNQTLISLLSSMMHSPIENYGGIPGLTSWLIGAPSETGLVRLLECSRDHQEPIIPHSHRFDFHCTVLAGTVRNIIWTEGEGGDLYQQSTMSYRGQPGQYERQVGKQACWSMSSQVYQVGEKYSMRADEVHSIFFSRGAAVLFFEGPQIFDSSIIIEPVVRGIVVPTFQVPVWAFARATVGEQA